MKIGSYVRNFFILFFNLIFLHESDKHVSPPLLPHKKE